MSRYRSAPLSSTGRPTANGAALGGDGRCVGGGPYVAPLRPREVSPYRRPRRLSQLGPATGVTTGSRVFVFVGGALWLFEEPTPTTVSVVPTIDPAMNATHRFGMLGLLLPQPVHECHPRHDVLGPPCPPSQTAIGPPIQHRECGPILSIAVVCHREIFPTSGKFSAILLSVAQNRGPWFDRVRVGLAEARPLPSGRTAPPAARRNSVRNRITPCRRTGQSRLRRRAQG